MNGATLFTALLMSVFMGLVTFNLIRGLDVGCGCFSSTTEESMSPRTLVRDFVFLGIALGLTTVQARRNRYRTQSSKKDSND